MKTFKILLALGFLLISAEARAQQEFSLFEQQALKTIVQQWITAGSSIGGAGHTVHEEGGAALTQRAGINCVGAGILCQDNGGYTEINVPGGTSTFADLLAGTSKGQALVVGDGSTLAATGTGTITATTAATATTATSATSATSAETAKALAADPANCAAGTLPRGVTAAGVGDGCAKADLTTEVTGVLPLANGGTNANSAANARTNLSVPSKAELQAGAWRLCSAANASDTYTCTVTPTLTAYTAGMGLTLRATVTANTGAASVAVDGLAAIPIVRYDNSALQDGDIAVNAFYPLNYDGTSFRLPQAGGGVAVEADTLDTVFDRGKVANSANSFANALRITDATGDGWAFYRDGTLGPVVSPICGGVENDCDKVQRLASAKKFAIANSAGVEKFTLNETTGAVTNFTIDAEGTGNTISMPVTMTFEAAGCDNATPSPMMDLPTAAAPTPTCFGTTTTQGTLSFADGSTSTASRRWKLPTDWNGSRSFDVSLDWFANAASANAVRWSVATGCVLAGGAVNTGPSYNAASAVNATYTGTANQLRITTITGVAMTNCGANRMLYLQVSRIGGDGGDTLAAAAELLQVSVTMGVSK